MSIAHFLQGASPFGPIFAKELRVTSRRKRTYWMRVIYLVLLLLVLLGAYSITTLMGRSRGAGIAVQNQERSLLGQVFFAIYGLFSIWSMGLIGPILTATAVGSERLQKTLPVLLMTPITAWQIVSGKLFSRLLVALTLIGLGLPVLALVRLLGGVELEQMLGVVALAVVAALSSASIGLFYSTLLNRSYVVILLTYGTLILMYVFAPVVIVTFAEASHSGPGVMMTIVKVVLAANPYAMAYPAAMPAMISRMAGSLPWGWCIGSHLGLTAVLLALCARILRRQARRAGEQPTGTGFLPGVAPVAPLAHIGPPPLPPGITQNVSPGPESIPALPPALDAASPGPLHDGAGLKSGPVLPYRDADRSRVRGEVADNPVLWREMRRPMMGRRWQRLAALAICLAVFGTLYGIQSYAGDLNARGTQIAYAMFFNFIFSGLALVLSATVIAQEKESDTWTLLLATPLAGRTIVWGKTFGILRRLAAPLMLIAIHFLIFTAMGVITVKAWLCVLWIILTFNSVWIATGIYFSLRIRKTTYAVIVNLLIAFSLYAVVPAVLAIYAAWRDSNDSSRIVRQVLWYLPYYYLGETIDGARNIRGWEVRFEPLQQYMSLNGFIGIMLAVGSAHLLAAWAILAHTAHHFDRIVGRARQFGMAPKLPRDAQVAVHGIDQAARNQFSRPANLYMAGGISMGGTGGPAAFCEREKRISINREQSLMSDQLFKTLELTRLRRALAKIHEQVSCQHGRVEITRDGCEDVCVILSKAELESLERALEILSETTEFKSMCETLTQVAAACGVAAPAECEA